MLPNFAKLAIPSLISGALALAPITAQSGPFDNALLAMQENSWGKLNTNSFSDVWAPAISRPLSGTGNPSNIISAWSSMSWDPNRGDLIFWGGGHANYPGNEVYRWRSSDLRWERASLPSEIVNFGGNNWESAGGVTDSPVAAHTYDNSEFLPNLDRMITFGGAAWNTGGAFQDFQTGGVRTGPYLWDPSKADANKVGGSTGTGVDVTTPGGQMWQNRETLPNCFVGSGKRIGCATAGFINGTSAYTEENGKDVLYINDGALGDLWKYTINDVNDPSQDQIKLVGQRFESFSGQGAAAFDPTRNLYVRTAEDWLTFWDVTAQSFTSLNKRFRPTDITGEFRHPTFGFRFYGIEYDPVRDRFLLWDGDGEIWVLDIPAMLNGTEDWEISKLLTASTDNPMQSDGSPFRGVLGKWKYVSEYDVFLGALDPNSGDIWAYKPDGWSPTALSVSGPPPQSVSEPEALGALMLLLTFGLLVARRPREAARRSPRA